MKLSSSYIFNHCALLQKRNNIAVSVVLKDYFSTLNPKYLNTKTTLAQSINILRKCFSSTTQHSRRQPNSISGLSPKLNRIELQNIVRKVFDIQQVYLINI